MGENLDGAAQTGPRIILVEPQLGENIGAAARAMANFGLGSLHLVNPRQGWPDANARANASGADHVIDRVTVHATAEEAVADLSFVLATTARQREVAKTVRGPAEAAGIMRELAVRGERVGVLFGRERSGLTNEEVALADEILTFPVDPGFSSLNIAQAVLLVAYEWRRAGADGERGALPFAGPDEEMRASKTDLLHLFAHLEGALDAVTFFRPPEKKPHMVLSLRTLLQRAQLTEQEVRTLRGVIAALEGRKTRPSRKRTDE